MRGIELLVPDLASIDPIALILSAAALLALLRFKLGMLAVLAGAAACGLVLRLIFSM